MAAKKSEVKDNTVNDDDDDDDDDDEDMVVRSNLEPVQAYHLRLY